MGRVARAPTARVGGVPIVGGALEAAYFANPGVADWTGAIQAALNTASALSTLGLAVGEVLLPAGTMTVSSPLVWPDGVSLRGAGPGRTVLAYTGNTLGAIVTAAGSSQSRATLRDFSLDLSANPNAVSGIDLQYGASRCHFEDIFIALNAANVAGFRLRGSPDGGATASNNQYNNILSGVHCNGGLRGFWLEGYDVLNTRVNSNKLWGCRADSTVPTCRLVDCNGNGNVFQLAVNTCPGDVFYFTGDQGIGNLILSPYFDGGIAGNLIHLADLTGVGDVVIVVGGIGFAIGGVLDDLAPALPRYTVMVPGNMRVNYAQVRNYLDLASDAAVGATAVALQGDLNNGVLIFRADPVAAAARLLLSGSTFNGGVNAVSNDGGLSACLQEAAAAEFRVVKTANGNAYTQLFGVTRTGHVCNRLGPYLSKYVGVVSAAGVATLDCEAGNIFEITLTENTDMQTTGGTHAAVSGTTMGQIITLRLRQAAGGEGWAVTFNAADFLLAGGAFAMTPGASKVDMLQFMFNGTTPVPELLRRNPQPPALRAQVERAVAAQIEGIL